MRLISIDSKYKYEEELTIDFTKNPNAVMVFQDYT